MFISRSNGFRPSMTIDRPFALPIHFQSQMRHEIEVLSGQSTNTGQSQERSIAELQIYVDFVDKNLMPDYHGWKSAKQTIEHPSRIRFDDLWYLFEPGELVHIPYSAEFADRPTASKDPAGYLSIGRIIYSSIYFVPPPGRTRHGGRETRPSGRRDEEPRWGGGDLGDGSFRTDVDPMNYEEYREADRLRSRISAVCAYYLEYDGEKWASILRHRRICSFTGEKDVSELEIYLLKFVTGYKQVLEQGVADGEAVAKLIEDRFGFYNGWSLIADPDGRSVLDMRSGREIRSPTHIGSDVLVDCIEAFNTIPH